METAGRISIEVKIRDIERLEETAEKCFALAKASPYAAYINIRVDETSKDIALCTETVATPSLEK